MSGFVNQQNARPGVYDEVIRDIAQKNVCPFCAEDLAEFHKNPVELRTYWVVTDNMYPYTPKKHHKLLIHREHIQHLSEISVEAWAELQVILREQTEKNAMVGGTFVMRFGETKFTGASVQHLHANLVQSNPDDPAYDPAVGLRVRIG